MIGTMMAPPPRPTRPPKHPPATPAPKQVPRGGSGGADGDASLHMTRLRPDCSENRVATPIRRVEQLSRSILFCWSVFVSSTNTIGIASYLYVRRHTHTRRVTACPGRRGVPPARAAQPTVSLNPPAKPVCARRGRSYSYRLTELPFVPRVLPPPTYNERYAQFMRRVSPTRDAPSPSPSPTTYSPSSRCAQYTSNTIHTAI